MGKSKLNVPITVGEFRRMSGEMTRNIVLKERVLRALEERQRLLGLIAELDVEMDGVRCPQSAAAILNALRSILNEYR